MERPAALALAAALIAGPALAQTAASASAKPLPAEAAPRGAACTAILSAMAGTVRPSSPAMADELDALARRWRAKAEAEYKALDQTSKGEQTISAMSMELIGQKGLPGGTFDKAATCQAEGAALPAPG